jgi:hypothetical protein
MKPGFVGAHRAGSMSDRAACAWARWARGWRVPEPALTDPSLLPTVRRPRPSHGAGSAQASRPGDVFPQGLALREVHLVAGHCFGHDDISRIRPGAQQVAKAVFVVSRRRAAATSLKAEQSRCIQYRAKGNRSALPMAVLAGRSGRWQRVLILAHSRLQPGAAAKELGASFSFARLVGGLGQRQADGQCDRGQKAPEQRGHGRLFAGAAFHECGRVALRTYRPEVPCA